MQVLQDRPVSARLGMAACFAALILTLQLLLAADTFNDRFLNTFYHYFFDNAFFTTAARHANSLGVPANRCGIVLPVAHRGWNEPSASPSFYTHHPYGVKLLMQQVMLVVGHGEAVSRGFSLAVSMCAALGMFATLSMLTGSLWCGTIGAAVFISLPVMALYQTCVKFEIDGMASSAWIVPCVIIFVEWPTPFRRGLLLAAGVVAALSSWTGLMFAVLMSSLLIVSGDSGPLRPSGRCSRSAGILLAAGLALGGALLLALFVWQKGGLAAFVADLGGAFRAHSERREFTNAEWAARQWGYGMGNFGVVGLTLLGAGLLLIVRGMFPSRATALLDPLRRGYPQLLFLFLSASMATAVLWVTVFREGSMVHEYWALVACMPIATAAAILVNAAPPAYAMAAYAMGVLVVGVMYATSWQAFAGRLESMRGEGTRPDVEFVMSFRNERFDRFVFVPLGDHLFNIWFHPRLFEYYTDRTVVPIAPGVAVGRGDKVILLAYDEQATAEDLVESRFGITLTNRRTGPRFCVYDALPAEAAGGVPADPKPRSE
jgi:hypothetical protein